MRGVLDFPGGKTIPCLALAKNVREETWPEKCKVKIYEIILNGQPLIALHICHCSFSQVTPPRIHTHSLSPPSARRSRNGLTTLTTTGSGIYDESSLNNGGIDQQTKASEVLESFS